MHSIEIQNKTWKVKVINLLYITFVQILKLKILKNVKVKSQFIRKIYSFLDKRIYFKIEFN